MTKIEQQFEDLKARHPGMLILFRCGDFYESFGDQAKLIGTVCGLTITTRDKTFPMAGFPASRLEYYVGQLTRAGHRVAVCEPENAK